jgi:hypothetical protein
MDNLDNSEFDSTRLQIYQRLLNSGSGVEPLVVELSPWFDFMREIEHTVEQVVQGTALSAETDGFMSLYMLLMRMNREEIGLWDIQNIFLAGAVCAEKENNPNYLRSIEQLLATKEVKYDRNVWYRKAVRYLQMMRRYDFYLIASPEQAYRSGTERVMKNIPDPTIRLDLLETDEEVLESLLKGYDRESIMRLISYAILSIGVISREKTNRIMQKIAELDPWLRRKTLLSQLARYSTWEIEQAFDSALRGEHATPWALTGQARVALGALREDIIAIAEMITEAGIQKGIEGIRLPALYERVRSIVPEDVPDTLELSMNSVTSIRWLNAQRKLDKSGKRVSDAALIVFAIIMKWELERYSESLFEAFDTFTSNMIILEGDLKNNVNDVHTRTVLITDAYRVLLDIMHALWAYDYATRDPRIGEIRERARTLEKLFSDALSEYIDNNRDYIRRWGNPPSVSDPSIASTRDATIALDEVERARLDRASHVMQYVVLEALPTNELARTFEEWRYFIQNETVLPDWLTEERIQALKEGLKTHYIELLKSRFSNENKNTLFLTTLPFETKHDIIIHLVATGFASVTSSKIEEGELYRSLGTFGIAETILEMLEILSALETQIAYRSR